MSPSHEKAFATLAAQFALAGLELKSEMGIDGTERLHTFLRGKVVQLSSLDHARSYLAQIGGSHGPN